MLNSHASIRSFRHRNELLSMTFHYKGVPAPDSRNELLSMTFLYKGVLAPDSRNELLSMTFL